MGQARAGLQGRQQEGARQRESASSCGTTSSPRGGYSGCLAGRACVHFFSFDFKWGGHTISLATVYLPSADPVGQKAFIRDHLQPLVAASPNLLLAGDFNFVLNEALDRTLASGRDAPVAAVWSAACPTLVDVYRAAHPSRRAYTFISSSAASRLDRFHAAPSLASRITACGIMETPGSDHRLLSLTLASALPPAAARFPSRVRLNFLPLDDLREAFQA